MWLTSSSVGRKFIMALTGICLVLFVTFHCLMNSVAILWPAAYNVICEFLGANWYALIASIGLAVLFIIHIIYACWLTILNRKARGNDRYAINGAAPGVEWSSKNMLVLGIVILAFLVVHLIQFWAKMQLVEICGCESVAPPAAGTLFLQEAFSLVWTPIVYIIGFIALWFHMNHGFWSMFQSIGWDNTTWIPRLKKIGCWWTTIVIALFIAQAIVFTVEAHKKSYLSDKQLKEQYIEMETARLGETFGDSFSQIVAMNGGEMFLYQFAQQIALQPQAIPQIAQQLNATPQEFGEAILGLAKFLNYINEGAEYTPITTGPLEEAIKKGIKPEPMQMITPEMMQQAAEQGMQPQEGQPQPEGMQPEPTQPQEEMQEAPVSEAQQAADEAPAEEPKSKKTK